MKFNPISQYYTLYHGKQLLGVGAVHTFGDRVALACRLQDGQVARGWFATIDEALEALGETFGGADAVDAYEVDFVSYDVAKRSLIVQPRKSPPKKAPSKPAPKKKRR